MKDYNNVGIISANKIMLTLQKERESEVEFSDVFEASSRFLHLAEAASQDGILGLQISADESGEFSCVAFTGTEVNGTTEDFNWAFKTIAVFNEYRGHFLENLYEGNRKVYALDDRFLALTITECEVLDLDHGSFFPPNCSMGELGAQEGDCPSCAFRAARECARVTRVTSSGPCAATG
jgi:hypothetical protein